jgi:Xaa-Pro aminopeptidase
MNNLSRFSSPTIPFPSDEYSARTGRLERALSRNKLDAMFLIGEPNRTYLTGFNSSAGVIVAVPGEKPALYTDFRYLEMARAQLDFVNVHKVGKWKKQFGPEARRRKWKRVGYEGSLPAARLKDLQNSMPTVTEWVEAEQHVRDLRAVKSEREQAVMRDAGKVNDWVHRLALQQIRPGMTEWDIRCLIRSLMDSAGQGESFNTIVCIGSNASKCHHFPSLRPLDANTELLLDHGTTVQGYCSDMTRTLFIGKPSRKLQELHKIVLAANRKAIASVRAGVACDKVDAVARKHIAKAGYGKYFGHGLGHSVGIEIHEFPAFSASCKTVLKPGMVMTIEPGIYIPGVGGVRIEDMVIVTRKGCEVITDSPREVTL